MVQLIPCFGGHHWLWRRDSSFVEIQSWCYPTSRSRIIGIQNKFLACKIHIWVINTRRGMTAENPQSRNMSVHSAEPRLPVNPEIVTQWQALSNLIRQMPINYIISNAAPRSETAYSGTIALWGPGSNTVEKLCQMILASIVILSSSPFISENIKSQLQVT